ncbi:gene transfer agent family protein [Neomegalonema perideroedes]|uniref:gene transfer agent family protein n=1 Tax=Neomegalonema perideroedes TaxID=217219 RepID=UPI000367E81F|nr:gene transfer agent family protein [Neomegalonema perideroedes]
MPFNPHRGEIEALLDGSPRRLRLTLGALAELEQTLGAEDLPALAARFESGSLRAADLTAVIGAGLRGAGAETTDAEVSRMEIPGGASGAARLAADLLKAAFGA